MVYGCCSASGPRRLAFVDGRNKIPILSGHFSGQCKTICLPAESQQKLGDASGQ